VSVHGRLRLKLCDFVNVVPAFSRIDMSFIERPQITFSLQASGVQLLSIPLVSGWLDEFVKRELVDDYVYPRCNVTLLASDAVAELRAAGELVKYGQRSDISEGMLKVF